MCPKEIQFDEDKEKNFSESSYSFDNEDDERADLTGKIDLRGKSLTNASKLRLVPKEPKKESKPMQAIMKEILEKGQATPAGKAKSVLFSKKKQILKKVEKEKKNAKLEAIKSHLKKKQQSLGKVLPNYSREKEYERNLKMVTVEGSKQNH